jgi:cell division GTPase FtsZ
MSVMNNLLTSVIGINKTGSAMISNLTIENTEIYKIDSKKDLMKHTFHKFDIIFVVIDLCDNINVAMMVIENLKNIKILCIPILIQNDSSKIAKKNLKNIQKVVKSVVIIANKNAQLLLIEISEIINTISELILSDGFINLDFADLLTVMNINGITKINTTECISSSSLEKVLLELTFINSAKAVLINFTIHSNYQGNILNTMETVVDSFNENTNLIIGIAYDDLLDTSSIKISVIASGIPLNINDVF